MHNDQVTEPARCMLFSLLLTSSKSVLESSVELELPISSVLRREYRDCFPCPRLCSRFLTGKFLSETCMLQPEMLWPWLSLSRSSASSWAMVEGKHTPVPMRDTSQERNVQRKPRRLVPKPTMPTSPRHPWEVLVLRSQPALRRLSEDRVCVLCFHKTAMWLWCL